MANSHNIHKNSTLDTEIESLKFSTINVRGLRNNIKLNAIMQIIKKLDFDIVALQETHLLSSEISQIESKWNGPCILAEGATNS